MIDATTIAVIRKMISKYCGASSSDVNAIIKKYLQDNPVTASSIGAETTSDATTKYNSLNKLINDLQTKLNNIADSDDETLDQFSELVTYIKNNKSLIDQLQTILEKSEQHKVDKSVLYDVLHNTPHADTVGDFFDLRRTGKIYRTRFYTFAKNPTCKGTKLLDNAGLQYEPSTDTVEGKDDYLNGEHPLFEWYNCNYKRNADGTAYPTAIEGEDGVIQPSFYYNFEINTEEGYIDVTISDMPHTLRTDIVLYPWNECLQADGTVLPWCIGSKYISSIGDDGLLRSLPDRQPEGNASYETMITDYQKKGAGYWGAGAERNTFQIIFILIKGATKNSQSLFAGCTDYYIKLPVSIKNTGESVYVTTNKDASAFFVGAPVYVGHNGGDGHVVIDIAPTKVIKIEPIDSNNTAIYLDVKNESFISTAGVDIDETEYLVSIPWYSGTTDNVIGKHDGSMISNSNSKYPYRVQGREYSIGLQMVASDTVTVLKDDSTRDVYVAPRGTHHTTDESNIKKNYNLIGSIPAQENTSPEYWVGDIKINTNTGVWFPSYQGSGDSQGFADCIIGDDVCLLSSYVYGGFARVGSYGGFVSLECTIWYDETNGFEASAD